MRYLILPKGYRITSVGFVAATAEGEAHVSNMTLPREVNGFLHEIHGGPT